ncbi:hypothetical protein [Mucilaginibacter sp.]|uniref:hypothetical protein n=1 Tax=Mucilaginibacter sp. TaxID=1882438 RepID=UPI002616F0C3|nr:hypothetical protein [Mucilaginibacter sp.]
MRVKLFISTLLFLMLNAALLYAQDPGAPCSAQDVDLGNCPLDSWVVVIAVAAVIFAAWHLNNQQKKSSRSF